jgi:hypothetical protein
MISTFSKSSDLPSLNSVGFKVINVPEKTFGFITQMYEMLKQNLTQEPFAQPGNNGVLQNTNNQHATDIMSIDLLGPVKDGILNDLKSVHEEWCGHKLIPVTIYGIRSYKKDSYLKSHIDRIETHHVSSIIIVDKKCEEDWPLDIKDHKGNWHKVYANIGQMILYESAKCEHGRVTPFKGEYFRNMFVHYRLNDWEFKY